MSWALIVLEKPGKLLSSPGGTGGMRWEHFLQWATTTTTATTINSGQRANEPLKVINSRFWVEYATHIRDFFLFFGLDLVISFLFITLLWNNSLLKLWEMDTSIQVVSEFQRRAVIAIVIVMEEWSSGDESIESSLVSEFFNILLSLWHSFITSTLVRSDFLPNQIFFVYLMTVYQ